MTDVTASYSNRQYELVAIVDFDYSTFTDGTVDQVLALPAGSVITEISLQVLVVFNSTTPIFSVGLYSESTTDPDVFLDAVSLATANETFQVSLGSADEEAALDASVSGYAIGMNQVVEEDEIAVLYAASSGTATAGRAQLTVRYLVPGRSNENQG